MQSKLLHQVTSSKPLDEIEKALNESAARHQFSVLAVHDLRQTMAMKGVALAMDCRIYEVCNPQQAKRVLEVDGAISTALPCRISVYGSGGSFTIATMLPTGMMQAFGKAGVESVAAEVEQVIVAMMNDAAG